MFPEDKNLTGNGVNDTPALKRADVGEAVQGPADGAVAADIVLIESGMSTTCTDNRLIPIVAIQGPANICTNYKRLMYPLAVAHARTCHSMQGYTAENGVVMLPSKKKFAGNYVANSRAKENNSAALWF